MRKLPPDIIHITLVTALGMSTVACTAAANNQQAPAASETVMSDTLRGTCSIASAKITLVNETIMTRAALNAETAAAMGKTTDLAKGDPKLKKLALLLDGTNPVLTDTPSLDARLVIRLTCDNGNERVITGSPSSQQGMSVEAGGKIYRVPATFRSDIEALLR